MRLLIEGFEHLPGVHCGSTALRDMLAFHGFEFSEESVFGLGAGLDFHYFSEGILGPGVFVGGRAAELEAAFCRNLGIDCKLENPSDREAWPRARARLDAGRPVMVSLDMYYLGYLGVNDHFGAHRVVFAGYDEEARTVIIADREQPGLVEADWDEVSRARSSKHQPFPPGNLVFELGFPPELYPLEEAFDRALAAARSAALAPVRPQAGLQGMKLMADDVRRWPRRMDTDRLRTAARLAYILIEVGGTGGGCFRLLWSRFLAEFAERLGRRDLKQAAEDFAEAARVWTGCAMRFLDAARTAEAEPVHAAADLALEARDLEARAWDGISTP